VNVWRRMRERFWFLPALLCVASVALAEGLILIDRHLVGANSDGLAPVLVRVGESGSRDLLGAIAASTLTVASTTFSITVAVLAVSSSTYGPRLVRNFMADRGNQLVLGIFVATFLYSLIVLRSIRAVGDDGDQYFVPHLAVNMAVLLAVTSIGVLVYFIHHISDSVQVWTLVERVNADLVDVIDRLYPEDDDSTGAGPVAAAPGRLLTVAETSEEITTTHTGYVQGVDLDRLVSVAAEHDVVVVLRVRPGLHITRDAVVAVVSPADRVGDDCRGAVRQTIHVGRGRTPDEDVEFPVHLLEEMAVRALSAGTNDPYTAINALHSLAGGLVLLAGRPKPSPYRHDPEGRLRVVTPVVDLLDLVDHVFDALRVYATAHPMVLHQAMELALQIGTASDDRLVATALDEHAQRLIEAFTATSPHRRDLDDLSRHAARLRAELLGGGGAAPTVS